MEELLAERGLTVTSSTHSSIFLRQSLLGFVTEVGNCLWEELRGKGQIEIESGCGMDAILVDVLNGAG